MNKISVQIVILYIRGYKYLPSVFYFPITFYLHISSFQQLKQSIRKHDDIYLFIDNPHFIGGFLIEIVLNAPQLFTWKNSVSHKTDKMATYVVLYKSNNYIHRFREVTTDRQVTVLGIKYLYPHVQFGHNDLHACMYINTQLPKLITF